MKSEIISRSTFFHVPFLAPFFLLSILEGFAALAALSLIPSEGLSFARLVLVGVILLPLAASGWLFVCSLDADWRARHLEPTAHPSFFRFLPVFSSLLFLTSGLLLFLLRYLNPEATASYFVRARPVLTYLLLLAAQTCLWLTVLRNGFHPQALQMRRGVFVSAVVIWHFSSALADRHLHGAWHHQRHQLLGRTWHSHSRLATAFSPDRLEFFILRFTFFLSHA